MKKRIPSFISGMLTTALIVALSVSALAATGTIKLEVNPISVLVNGEEFHPKDAKGNDAMVFSYNGTTYAPLRALAETYGLEVGYDSEKNLATVSTPNMTVPSQYESADYIHVGLAKVDGKYYQTNKENRAQMSYYILNTGTESLLFTMDISVSDSGNFPSSHYLNYILRLALLEDYTVEDVDNPYVEGFINIVKPGLLLEGSLAAGIDTMQYLSPTETYKPQWYEYNGKKLYNAQTKSDELTLAENGIRYYKSYVCVNDVLKYWGINKQVSAGQYQGSWYLEVK